MDIPLGIPASRSGLSWHKTMLILYPQPQKTHMHPAGPMQAWALGHCRCWDSQLWLPHLLLPASLPSSISHSRGWTALNLSVFTREVMAVCTAPRCPHRDGTNLITPPCTRCTQWEQRRGQASSPPALPQPDIIVLMVYFILINMTRWRALLVPMPLVSGVPERLAGTSRLIPTPPSDRAAIIIPASHGGGGSGNSWRLNISTQGQAERSLFPPVWGPFWRRGQSQCLHAAPSRKSCRDFNASVKFIGEEQRECPPGHRVQKQTSSVERQGHQTHLFCLSPHQRWCSPSVQSSVAVKASSGETCAHLACCAPLGLLYHSATHLSPDSNHSS